MADQDLAGRIERISAATWPPIEEWQYDGWVLRFARGYTRRCNSITPVERGTRPLADKIAACEAAYAARHIPVVFRLPSTIATEELDGALAERNYYSADKTSIRVMALDATLPDPGGGLPGPVALDHQPAGDAAVPGAGGRPIAARIR